MNHIEYRFILSTFYIVVYLRDLSTVLRSSSSFKVTIQTPAFQVISLIKPPCLSVEMAHIIWRKFKTIHFVVPYSQYSICIFSFNFIFPLFNTMLPTFLRSFNKSLYCTSDNFSLLYDSKYLLTNSKPTCASIN